MLSSICSHKNFSQNVKTGGDIVGLINKLPFELHLPGHRYTGPGTHLKLNIKKGVKPKNEVDAAAMIHDIEYHTEKDLEKRHEADLRLQESTMKLGGMDSVIVNTAMDVKRKLGLGLTEVIKDDDPNLLSMMEKFDKLLMIEKEHLRCIYKPPPVDLTESSKEILKKICEFKGWTIRF